MASAFPACCRPSRSSAASRCTTPRSIHRAMKIKFRRRPIHASRKPTPSEEYWDREAAAREAEVLEQAGSSLFAESAAQEPPALDTFERIPTLPPPNREALSEIPFLMPPLLPPQNSEQPAAARATDAEAVDDMVRKVMEKLGPHLQELLSQGVKPLVENLLQNELHKKDRY